MLNFVFHKLLSKRWMTVCLLIGNILLIAIAAATPLYSQGVLQRTLTRNLSAYLEEENTHPGVINGGYTLYQKSDREREIPEMEKAKATLDQMVADMGIEPLEYVTHRTVKSTWASYVNQIEGRKSKLVINVDALTDVKEHINVVHGQMFSNQMVDNTIEVLVSQKTLNNHELIVGELLDVFRMTDQNGVSYKLKIVGVFEMADDQDLYWDSSPNDWYNVYLMDMDLFNELFTPVEAEGKSFSTRWRVVLDYTQLQESNAAETLQIVNRTAQQMNTLGAERLEVAFGGILRDFMVQAKKVNTTMWVLLLPIFALLAAFIFMVSRQMLEMEQNEISVFKSRGASKGQIIEIYLLQSIVVVLLSTVLGLPLGWLICRVIGASNAFLEFVQRTALPVKMDMRVLAIVAVAALFSVCTMVLPVFRYSNVGIVETKRARSRKVKLPWWQICCLDLVLLGVAVYGLFQFRGQEEYLLQKVMDGAGLDPLLYICSSLFMIGAGLLCARSIPWMIKLIFLVGKRFWPPSLYASFMRILRTKDNQDFLVVFLILTVSMGIFSAQTARTINANAEDQLRYTIGADVVIQPSWGYMYDGEQVYREPDADPYMMMEEVNRATKVLVDPEITVSMDSGKIENVTLMGIHTKEFGETAWFKDSLTSIHWYEYLNAIAQNSRAILLSSQFRDSYGFQVGDSLTFTNADGFSIRGVIYGFFDYWPSYSSTVSVKDSSGTYQRQRNLMIVANLGQIQSTWGVTPYEIWMDVEDSTQFLYDYAAQNKVFFSVFRDTSAELIKLKNDPVFQGTNGILTVGFVVILLLCTTGFLIYWILSIHSRTLQFGIFRAMGMSMREILAMLITEQLFVSGTAIGVGVLVGKLCSQLYIPLIQIVYAASDRAIPLEIITNPSDDLRLGIVIGLMIVLCMVILGVLISKIKISQALKLGED